MPSWRQQMARLLSGPCERCEVICRGTDCGECIGLSLEAALDYMADRAAIELAPDRTGGATPQTITKTTV